MSNEHCRQGIKMPTIFVSEALTKQWAMSKKAQGSWQRGQVSLELLITVGIIFAFTIPVLLLLLSVSQFGYETSTLSQADAASKTIADNINELFVQGPGSKKTITIAFPTNMQNLSIKGKEVVIRLKTSSGAYEAVSPIFANATIINPSSLNNRVGLFPITLRTKSKPNGDVEVEVYG